MHVSAAAAAYHIENAFWIGEEPTQLAFAVVEDDRIHHPVCSSINFAYLNI